ncbi:MAG: response regulator [Chloroflexi bacterium]|nr:response regulator [Chloroflexota bacterium]MBP8058771.1 response regulator [Chloroflexota bacterium]
MSQTVLIVDDEPMTRKLLRLMLTRANYQVIEASDGYEALEAVTSQSPDAVLLDVMMPGMNGYMVCTYLRSQEKTSRLPIIMLSARGDSEGVSQAMAVGATEFMQKPISPGDLLIQLQKVLPR